MLESPTVRDGDAGFIGYASRINPVSLPAGMLQLSENMRLDRGVAVTRKGAKRLADEISPGSLPLTVPFGLTPEPSAPVVQSVYTGGVFASCVLRSPDETNSIEVIVLAGPDRAFTYLPDDGLIYSSTWADGVLAVDGTDNLVSSEGNEVLISKLPASIAYPTSPDEVIHPSDKVTMLQAYDRLYLLREADPTQPTYGTQYTNASGITVSSTTATINVDAHGYTASMRVRIDGGAAAGFAGVEYEVATVSTNSFTVTVPAGTSDTGCNVANIKVRRVKAPLYWTGDPGTNFVKTTAGIPDAGVSFRRMRSVPWANYINNRLIIPDGKQNVMISDVLDPDLFDPFFNSFRVGAGGNDVVMAVHAWVDNTFLVFCRKSIWLATVSQFASTDGGAFAIDTPISKLELLTDEIGCAARRTIQTAGNYVYFLSDSGVYRLDTKLDLKLRGDTKPLSDPISDQLGGLNGDLIAESVACYFDNRYYIAVPLSGSDRLDGVFIYSQLNEQWETRDLYGFGVDNFLTASIGALRRLLISNRPGKLMLLDELETGDQMPDIAADVIEPVPGRIRTRRYGFGTMQNKRFVRSLADVVLPNTAAVTVKAIMVNPDSEITLVPGQTNTSGLDEDYTLKNPIRAKAHYAELEFLTTANRPEIRNVSIEAAASSRPQTETRHAA
jgi:hypothetical protein